MSYFSLQKITSYLQVPAAQLKVDRLHLAPLAVSLMNQAVIAYFWNIAHFYYFFNQSAGRSTSIGQSSLSINPSSTTGVTLATTTTTPLPVLKN
jgi:hypothetical protein